MSRIFKRLQATPRTATGTKPSAIRQTHPAKPSALTAPTAPPQALPEVTAIETTLTAAQPPQEHDDKASSKRRSAHTAGALTGADSHTVTKPEHPLADPLQPLQDHESHGRRAPGAAQTAEGPRSTDRATVARLEAEVQALKRRCTGKEGELRSVMRASLIEQKDALRRIRKLQEQQAQAEAALIESTESDRRNALVIAEWQRRAGEAEARLNAAEASITEQMVPAPPSATDPAEALPQPITEQGSPLQFYRSQVDVLARQLAQETADREIRDRETAALMAGLRDQIRQQAEEAEATTTLIEQAQRELQQRDSDYRALKTSSVNSDDWESAKAHLAAQLHEALHERDSMRHLLEQEREQQERMRMEQAHELQSLQDALERSRGKQYTWPATASGTALPIAPEYPSTVSETAPNAPWYLRATDGEVFGPVSVRELIDWTVECRVDPEHDISADQTTWIKAAELPALRMDWIVDLGDGATYGPLNLYALHSLIGEGILGEALRVHHRRLPHVVYSTGALATPQDAGLISEIVRLQDSNEALQRQLEESQAACTRLQAEQDGLALIPPKAIHLPPKALRARRISARPV